MQNLYIDNRTQYTKLNNAFYGGYSGKVFAGKTYHDNIIDVIISNKDNINMNKFWKGFSSMESPIPVGDISYPFDAIKTGHYKIKDIIVGIIGNELIRQKFSYKAIKFPDNIKNVYWYQIGIPDEKNWYALFSMKYKNKIIFGFLSAGCCYTGFDVCGSIKVYLSNDIKSLLYYGVDKKIYDKIINSITK